MSPDVSGSAPCGHLRTQVPSILLLWPILVFLFLFCFFCLFRAIPVAYGGSQARGRIGATVTGLHHSSQQCWILNPLSEARDQTHVLMDASQVR